ncbi:MAG: ribonuclease HI [Leptospirales bacterium]|nr:ribonuclease HI [Leptospirales bacterium]
MLVDNALNIYTDGSSFQNPRVGGIGMVFIGVNAEGQEFLNFNLCPPGYKGASNNQMELLACVMALEEAERLPELPLIAKIVVHSDSQYATRGYLSAPFWRANKWLNRDGRPVDHPELWLRLLRIKARLRKRIEFKWEKGHTAKHPYNKLADKLAKESARNPLNPPLQVVDVRRKVSKQQSRTGSVEMQGQTFVVRIVTSHYMSLQRMHKYKYEVMTPESPFVGALDIIYSNRNISLRPDHRYLVTVNTNAKVPLILEVHEEITD